MVTSEKWMRAFGELDESTIGDALRYRKERRSYRPLAAAAAIFVGAVSVIIPISRFTASLTDETTPGSVLDSSVGYTQTEFAETDGIAPEIAWDLLELVPISRDGRIIVTIGEDGSYVLENTAAEEVSTELLLPFSASFADEMTIRMIEMASYAQIPEEVLKGNEEMSFDVNLPWLPVYSTVLGKELIFFDEKGNVQVSTDALSKKPTEKIHASGDESAVLITITPDAGAHEGQDLCVEFDAGDATVFHYGFSGMTASEDGQIILLGKNDAPAYILVCRGSLDGDVLLDGDANLQTEEMIVADAVSAIVRDDRQRLEKISETSEQSVRIYEAEPYLYAQAVIDWMYEYSALSETPEMRYQHGNLTELVSDVRCSPRIFFTSVTVQVPALERVTLMEENQG